MSENFLPSTAVMLIGQPVSDTTIEALNARLREVQQESSAISITGTNPEGDLLLETEIRKKYNSRPHTDLTGDIGVLNVSVDRMSVQILGDCSERAELLVEIATKEFPFSFFQFTTPLKSAIPGLLKDGSHIMYNPRSTMNQNLSRKIRHETRNIITDFCTEMADKVSFADRDNLASIF